MKLRLLKVSTFVLVLCCSISCTSEISEVVLPVASTSISDVEVVDGKLLKFQDQTTYETYLDKVNRMSDKERVSFLESLPFNSQLVMLSRADEELRTICESEDRKAAKGAYDKYREKYGKTFLFNEHDSSDLSPYIRLATPTDEFFSNENGEFMIGDSLVKNRMYTSFQERKSHYLAMTRGESSDYTSINHAYSHQSDRKVGLYLEWKGSVIYVKFTSQKKTWFGWVRYSTIYSANFNLSGGNFEFYQSGLTGASNPIWVNKDGMPFGITTKELGGEHSEVFGRTSYSPISGGKCTGTMEIWSRGVSYANRGLSKVSL